MTGDVFQPSAPFKIGELVKVVNGAHRRFAIVASEYYHDNYGRPLIYVMIGEKTHPISPYHLERVNND